MAVLCVWLRVVTVCVVVLESSSLVRLKSSLRPLSLALHHSDPPLPSRTPGRGMLRLPGRKRLCACTTRTSRARLCRADSTLVLWVTPSHVLQSTARLLRLYRLTSFPQTRSFCGWLGCTLVERNKPLWPRERCPRHSRHTSCVAVMLPYHPRMLASQVSPYIPQAASGSPAARRPLAGNRAGFYILCRLSLLHALRLSLHPQPTVQVQGSGTSGTRTHQCRADDEKVGGVAPGQPARKKRR